MKRYVWLLEAFFLVVLSLPVAILPIILSLKAGEFLGLLLFYAWGSRRKIAIENIRKSEVKSQKSEVERIIKENFKNLGRSAAEVIKIYYGLGKKIIDSVEIEGAENFENARSKGKGVLFITGHCGNWELMAIAGSVKLSGMAVVARPINNPFVNRLVERARERYGNCVIYKKGALKNILQRLKNGVGIGILMDQAVLPDEGYVIDFLGRGAWTTKMPALIARKTGAAVLPAFIRRTKSGHKMRIYPEVELSGNEDNEKAVIEDTKTFSAFIEDYVKENPSEWLWIHRRWKRV